MPTPLRALTWVFAALATLLLAGVLWIVLFGWNWMRPPLERYALEKTGRELRIAGDLSVRIGWPVAHLHAAGVQFANPDWAQERQMLAAQGVDVAVDVAQLLRREIAFPEVRLDHAVLFLEKSADGRKSWLLDLQQQDEDARIPIGRIAIDQGTLGYDDVAQKTHIRSALSTFDPPAIGSASNRAAGNLAFTAQGQFKGLALNAQGSGGPVLALRDTTQPYPLTLNATLGRTHVKASGTVTGLLALSTVDMQMALQGDSLEQLYPVLGIAFPATRPYRTQGHLRHRGRTWRYESFTGQVGASDIAGFVQVLTNEKRPLLTASLHSKMLVLDDLGPVIGARPGTVAQAQAAAQPASATDATAREPARSRMLPDMPFHTARWGSVDADVTLHAQSIARDRALPIENLRVHLTMQDAVLTLEPLVFGFAGGQLNANITLNGNSQPIQAHAKVRARKLRLAKLFPTVVLAQNSQGALNGELDLAGSGNSVASMLATANGKLGLVVSGGQISRLLMEKAGLHIGEIVALTLAGDRLVTLRCVVADFDVTNGLMQTQALVLDTQVTTLFGSGTINLADEQLDLMLEPRTKNTSLVSLRSPIYVRGPFAKPKVSVDKARVALRAAGAVALGVINPLLALIPLVDAGPGKDSDCGQLVHDAKTVAK